jgi:hypothetical protein
MTDPFSRIESTLQSQGPAKAIDELCDDLRRKEEYNSLFYAMLMKKRLELGVVPIPTGPSADLPEAIIPAYEQAIRDAAREVGTLYLGAGMIPQAWAYFRMIDDPAPVKAALDALTPGDDDDIQPLVGIAFYEGVSPEKGFGWILQRYGLCSAITTAGGGELPHSDAVKQYCVKALIRALYHELRGRLANEVQNHGETVAVDETIPADTPGVVSEMLADWMFAEDAYHIDTSHLSSVVQMAMTLPPCLELDLARELCTYGARLTGRFIGQEEPPFDEGYRDYGVYLDILAGRDVEAGISHFRKKVEAADPEEVGTYPAEVYVNLMVKLGRGAEAIEIARKYLVDAEAQGRQLTCPNLNELCQRYKAYDVLADVAKQRGDAVHYLAGLLAQEPRTK